MKKVLVAGGAGYIGTHTMVELFESGFEVVCVDNLYNSSMEAVERVEKISGKKVNFYESDLLNKDELMDIFDKEHPDAVIMFAGYKAVGESVEKPLEYYYNNLLSLMNVCDVMRKKDCHSIIFSSSATVYGDPERCPVTEESPKGEITNPYGQTKSMIEQILMDLSKADDKLNVILLRYFNPIGAHPSGLIGEDPQGIPNNLVPYVAQVAVGRREAVHVFGNDYDTPDGTGVRDYIHVVDLAKGHVAALNVIEKAPGLHIYNLGTGTGYSVLDVIHAYEKACGKELKYVIDPRRPGDIAMNYCDPTKALKEMGWKAEKTIEDMCADSYRWQSMNPYGYKETEHPSICLQ
ncbi:MAG: UDP-glucose 4-epimerase GalE [Eubacteriales bacterium]|nr:UDP-glucose 4-epimerase GalE [Eubacteriales bacterium]